MLAGHVDNHAIEDILLDNPLHHTARTPGSPPCSVLASFSVATGGKSDDGTAVGGVCWVTISRGEFWRWSDVEL